MHFLERGGGRVVGVVWMGKEEDGREGKNEERSSRGR